MNLSTFKKIFRNTWFSPRYLGWAYISENLSLTRDYVTGVLADIGCGICPYEDLFRDRIDRYIKIDWPTSLANTRAQVISDALCLPLRRDSLDTVLALELLEHLPDPDKFVVEVARVLRPSGIFILSVPFLEPIHEEPRD